MTSDYTETALISEVCLCVKSGKYPFSVLYLKYLKAIEVSEVFSTQRIVSCANYMHFLLS